MSRLGLLLLLASLAASASATGDSYFGQQRDLAERLRGLEASLAASGQSLADPAPQLPPPEPLHLALGSLDSLLRELAESGALVNALEELRSAVDGTSLMAAAASSTIGQCATDGLNFANNIANYYNATISNCKRNGTLDCACSRQRSQKLTASSWILKVLDSFGKVPAGFLSGNTFWIGDYEQCTKLAVHQSGGNFKGQYCTLYMPINLDMSGALVASSSKCSNNSDPLQKGRKLAQSSVLRYGFCVPNSCDGSLLNQTLFSPLLLNITNNLLNQMLKGKLDKPLKKLPFIGINCHSPAKDRLKDDGFAIAMIVLLAFFAFLLIVGTAYEYLDYGPRAEAFPLKASQPGEMSRAEYYASVSGFQKALLAFSVIGNGKKVLSMEAKAGQLDCIHGIRFISMTWVILGHTYYFAAKYVANLVDFMQILKEFSSQAVLNATVSVDSFFVISGLLMTYLFLSTTNKRKGRNLRSVYHWIMYYVHRYIRLTPVYAIILGLDIGLFKYLTDGPLWNQEGVEINNCKDSWWYNILYVNNFFGVDDLCMGHSWYLAIDMQIYWVAPPVLVLFWFFAPGAILILTALIALHFGLNAYVEWDWDFPPNAAWTLAPQQFNPNPLVGLWYFKYDYVPTYTRCGTYCIGMLFGYALYRIHKRSGALKYHINRWLNLAIWLLMAVAACWVLYGLWPISRGDISPKSFNIFYAAANRLIWGVAVGWVVFACVTGNGGPVNTLLSSPYIFPFSRLTYCAYLIHPFVMYYEYSGADRPVYFKDHYTFVYYFFAHFTVAYALAFILSLAFESPILTLEKLILPRDTSDRKQRPATPPVTAAAAPASQPPQPPRAQSPPPATFEAPPTELKVMPRTPTESDHGSSTASSPSSPRTLSSLPPTSPWNSIAFPDSDRPDSSVVYDSGSGSGEDGGRSNPAFRSDQHF